MNAEQTNSDENPSTWYQESNSSVNGSHVQYDTGTIQSTTVKYNPPDNPFYLLCLLSLLLHINYTLI